MQPNLPHDYFSPTNKIKFLGHGNKRFWCSDCGRSYQYQRGLTFHRKYTCGKEPMFKCDYCPKRCYQKGNLQQHLAVCRYKKKILATPGHQMLYF